MRFLKIAMLIYLGVGEAVIARSSQTEGNGSGNIVIAVMGATGSGKTSFVNLVSGSNLQVGGGLHSCTSTVQSSQPFELDGRRITLIDTPGFDDTTKSDTDILKMIAEYLSTAYEKGEKLTGVIYLHRISDFRMGGISMRNFRVFRELCGDNTLKNVVIATNRWGDVSREVGEAREEELATQVSFFRPALDKGARLLRHENTLESGQIILRHLIHSDPLPLRIQHELVDEGMEISHAAAGKELDREVAEQAKRYNEEMRLLEEQKREEIRAKDEEARKELDARRMESEEEVDRVQAELKKQADLLAAAPLCTGPWVYQYEPGIEITYTEATGLPGQRCTKGFGDPRGDFFELLW